MTRESDKSGERRNWRQTALAAVACLTLAACGVSRTAEADRDQYAEKMAAIASLLNAGGTYNDVPVAVDTTVPVSSQMVDRMGAVGISQPVFLGEGVYGYFTHNETGQLVADYVETDSRPLYGEPAGSGPANPGVEAVDLTQVCRPPVRGETYPYCVVAANVAFGAGLDGDTERVGDLVYSGK